jgi:hypothetical protein
MVRGRPDAPARSRAWGSLEPSASIRAARERLRRNESSAKPMWIANASVTATVRWTGRVDSVSHHGTWLSPQTKMRPPQHGYHCLCDTNPYASCIARRDPLEVTRATPVRLKNLLQSSPPEKLTLAPAPGKWSIRDVLCHLADCEVVFAFRLRQAPAEDHHRVRGMLGV